MDTDFFSALDTALIPDSTKDPSLCTVPGCTNRRSNAGYGRLRKVCERHHHQRFNLDYNAGSARSRSLRQQFREDLADLERIADAEGLQGVREKLGELRKKY